MNLSLEKLEVINLKFLIMPLHQKQLLTSIN